MTGAPPQSPASATSAGPSLADRSWRERLLAYYQLMRLDRPVGIWLLLWPTLWGLWMAARGVPALWLLGVFVGGTVLMRSAGCVINDYADRGFDPYVERTKLRPLAAGRATPKEALVLFALLCLLALALAWPLNTLSLMLAVPAAVLAASYPFAKRFHSLPQAHLGLAFSWGVPMAYAATRNWVPWNEVVPLMAANICWVIAYDTFYAMSDRQDDLKIGVKSSAILFGRFDRLIIALLQIATLVLLARTGLEADLSWPYFVGLVGAAGFAVREQWMARHRDPEGCFKAFLHNVGFGAVVFAGITWAYAWDAWKLPAPEELHNASEEASTMQDRCEPEDPLASGDEGRGYCIRYGVQYTPPNWSKPLHVDIAVPQGEGEFPAVLLVHGGSWREGSRHSMDDMVEQLAQRGFVAATVGYRLAPEYRFPAQLRDLQEAVRWMRHNAKELHVQRQHIGVWGFSAGAHLALMLGVVGPKDGLSMPGARVEAVVGGGTPTDLSKFNDDDEPTLLGVTYEQDPAAYDRASPIHYAQSDDPPIFMYHGDRDDEVPLSHAVEMKRALDAVGAHSELFIVHGGGHEQQPDAAFEAAVQFLRRTLGSSV